MPSTIATGRIGNAGAWASRAGFATSSALYTVLLNTSDSGIEVWKSTNGTSWSHMDAADEPANFSATHPYSAWLHSDGYIYVAYFTATTTLRCRRFNTATDQWETTDVGGADIATTAVNTLNVRVAVRSDGDVLVGYNSAAAVITYARYEGVSWTAVNLLSASGWVNDIVIDGDDRAWYAITDDANNDNSYRSLSSTNVLGATTDFDATAHTTALLRGCQSVVYNDGTASRYAILGRDTGGEFDLYSGTTGADTLGTLTIFSGVTGTTPLMTSAGVITVGTGSSARLHVVWAQANSILRDFSNESAPTFTFQGADTTVLSSLADADVCPQWIQGGGGYGVLYQESGSVKVEWVVSPSFGTPATLTVTAAEATAQAEAVTFDAASALTVTEATATAQAEAVNLAAATPATLPVGTATATSQAAAVSLTGQARLPVTAATATAQAEAITLDAASRLTVTTATATAQGAAVTLDAASTLTVTPATATAQAEAVNLGAAAGATLAVSPATATAQAGAITLDAAALFATGTATATAAGQAVTLAGQARMVAASSAATAQAEAVTFDVAGRMIVATAAATAQAEGVTFDAAARLVLAAATATAQAGAVDLIGNVFEPVLVLTVPVPEIARAPNDIETLFAPAATGDLIAR